MYHARMPMMTAMSRIAPFLSRFIKKVGSFRCCPAPLEDTSPWGGTADYPPKSSLEHPELPGVPEPVFQPFVPAFDTCPDNHWSTRFFRTCVSGSFGFKARTSPISRMSLNSGTIVRVLPVSTAIGMLQQMRSRWSVWSSSRCSWQWRKWTSRTSRPFSSLTYIMFSSLRGSGGTARQSHAGGSPLGKRRFLFVKEYVS